MKKKTVGKRLIDALEEATQYHQGKVTLRSTIVELPDDPPEISSKDIKKIREALDVSQPVFAKYLGVSDKAVKGWERGASRPNGAAIRLMQIAKADAKGFRDLILRTSRKQKAAS